MGGTEGDWRSGGERGQGIYLLIPSLPGPGLPMGLSLWVQLWLGNSSSTALVPAGLQWQGSPSAATASCGWPSLCASPSHADSLALLSPLSSVSTKFSSVKPFLSAPPVFFWDPITPSISLASLLIIATDFSCGRQEGSRGRKTKRGLWTRAEDQRHTFNSSDHPKPRPPPILHLLPSWYQLLHLHSF